MSMLLVLLAAFARTAETKTALLVVDVQDCFLEAMTTSGKAGSLSVPASHIIPLINSLRANKSCLFDEVIFTQDYHPANHISFGSTHGLAPFSHLGGKGNLPLTCINPSSGNSADASCCPTIHLNRSSVDCTTTLCPPDGWDYSINNSDLITGNTACTQCASDPGSCFQTDQMMWTDHCLQSGDSTFPPSLDKRAGDEVIQKGMNQYVDAYSAFMDNTKNLKTVLDAELVKDGIDTLYIAGIATDVCVLETVRDALNSKTSNYAVNVIKDATAAVQGIQANYDSAIKSMEDAGATLYTTEQILAMDCPATATTGGAANVSSSIPAIRMPGIFVIASFLLMLSNLRTR